MFSVTFQHGRFSYLIQESILIIALSFLLLLNGSTNGMIDPSLQIGLAVLVSGAALVWVIAGQRHWPPAGEAFLVWIFLYLLAVIFSMDPRRSLNQMELMLFSVFLFMLVADLVARGWPRELFVKVLLVVGALILFISWMGPLLWYQRWLQVLPGEWLPDILYRPSSANVVAMFMNMLIMLAGARLLITPERGTRVLLALVVLLAAGMLYITSSRGGWLGTLAGLAVLGILSAMTGKVDPLKYWHFLRARPVWLAVLLLGFLGLAAGGGILLYRQTIHPTHGPVSTARSEFWPPAWQAFLHHPWTGTGPFTYSEAYLSANSVPPKSLFIHSHGAPLNLLAETGMTGAAGALLLAGAVLAGLRRQLREVRARGSQQDLGVILGAAAALAAAGVHSFFDCFHTEPIGLWVLVIALGAALGGLHPTGGERKRAVPRFINAWSLLLVAALWAEIWVAAPLHEGVELSNATRWEEAALAFDSAVSRDPASVIAYQQRALVNSVLAGQGKAGAIERAIADWKEVVRREPAWAHNYVNLGMLYLAENRLPDALRSLNEAVVRAPECGLCALNLGIVQETMGNTPDAVENYQLALSLDQPADAYFWRSTPVRQNALDSWAAQSQPRAVLSIEELEAKGADNPSAARSYIELSDRLIRENRLNEAQHLLERFTFAMSFKALDGIERDWLVAEVRYREGDLDGAAHQGYLALERYWFQGLDGPGSFGQLTYAPVMFRRPAMGLELVPQVVTIPLTDTWGDHVADLADWYERLGDPRRAEQLREALLNAIPDWN